MANHTIFGKIDKIAPMHEIWKKNMEKITSFEVLQKVPLVNLSKMCLRLNPSAYSSG